MSDKLPQEMASNSWAGEMGDKWNTYFETFEGMIAPVGEAAIEHACFADGDRVIDIGCGAGVTSFDIARRVGNGHVTGLDVSPVLVATARRRIMENGLSNVDFVCDDAAIASLCGYDVLFSRFGVMFFEEPVAAFSNMRGFLRPRGRLSFVCWGPPSEQPWVVQLMAIAAKYVELPPPVPNAPGPFAFGDPHYLRGILERSGFKNVRLTRWTGNQQIGGPGATPETAARFVMDALFLGDAMAKCGEQDKASAFRDTVNLLKDFVVNGNVEMQGCAWLVDADC
jgi:SAM-dependent methyltransferase